MKRRPKSNSKRSVGLLAWLDANDVYVEAGGSAKFVKIAESSLARALKVRIIKETYGVTRQTGYHWLEDYRALNGGTGNGDIIQ